MPKTIILIFILFLLTGCSIHKVYYDSGEIKGIGKVKNEKKLGEWKFYYKNGQIRQEGRFNEGKQDGVWLFYHPNGKRQGIGQLNLGERSGIWKWYHENAKIYTERLWDNGILIEVLACYDGNGHPLDKGTFKNGNGTVKLYDIKGNLLEVENYVDGKFEN